MSFITKTATRTVVAFDPSWKNILECAVVEVFALMAAAQLEPNPASDQAPRGEQTAMVGMAGALCGITTLRCNHKTAMKLASRMLGEEAAQKPSTSRDAMGELCNMIAGNFKSKISTLADHCMLSVPTVIIGEDYCMETAEPTEGVTVSYLFEGEPLWAALVIHS